ncbi:MAG: hypothetical protein IPJ65_05590 [Archangiaceae bacterium]|nr:hypothetical protein [Archangiaceae bacterium]
MLSRPIDDEDLALLSTDGGEWSIAKLGRQLDWRPIDSSSERVLALNQGYREAYATSDALLPVGFDSWSAPPLTPACRAPLAFVAYLNGGGQPWAPFHVITGPGAACTAAPDGGWRSFDAGAQLSDLSPFIANGGAIAVGAQGAIVSLGNAGLKICPGVTTETLTAIHAGSQWSWWLVGTNNTVIFVDGNNAR